MSQVLAVYVSRNEPSLEIPPPEGGMALEPPGLKKLLLQWHTPASDGRPLLQVSNGESTCAWNSHLGLELFISI